MSIKHAILGLLSWKSSTGYNLKKIFEESPAMYWSGNNNQIYKALIQLLEEGFVTNEIKHQESSPSKKVYTITEEGLAELRKWVASQPEAPEMKKSFLVQLAWADQLNAEELDNLLSSYENELRIQQLMQEEKKHRRLYAPDRTPREKYLWNMISENLISSYKSELDWVKKIREELLKKETVEEKSVMEYKIIGTRAKKYVELVSYVSFVSTEQDALEIISLCGENDTDLLLLHGNALSEDFFKLKTGTAGKIVQKFINYRVKTAVILSEQPDSKGKFREMVSELNRSNHFRFFESKETAEVWLTS
ncbi:MAG: DUF4180 domain-containing protein [Clostridia bacterium]|nr:DUF4180 domain-containing protein [Clostridia bacterium]